MQRVAGVTVPLSCLRSSRDWGIGEIGDLPACAEWLQSGGFKLLQLLPIYELADGETSPYGARTAFGTDPIFLSISALEDLEGETTAAFLGEEAERDRLRLRELPRIDFGAVRALKEKGTLRAFERFYEREWMKRSPRQRELSEFIHQQAGWEDDLALYVAIREEQGNRGWEWWPTPLRYRDPATMVDARARLSGRILRHHYEQWQLHIQWQRARDETTKLGFSLMGDLPFVVGRESADVWSRSRLFQEGLSLGAPPDELTPAGQDWGLPAYDWKALAESDFAWVRARISHAARHYHSFRLDHVVGYFRQYVRKAAELGQFDPQGEAEQKAHGELLLRAMQHSSEGAELIAEDLGAIPDFVRATMKSLHVPGYKVILWERGNDGKLRDPAEYDAQSVATWSTHDTLPIGAWFRDLREKEQGELLELMRVARDAHADAVEVALFELLFGAGSDLALVLVTELLGETARINTPGTVGEHNWTYRLPRSIESLVRDPGVSARMARFQGMLGKTSR